MDAQLLDTDAPRILVTPPGTLDTCVLTFPLLCALRERFADAHLVWAISQPLIPLVRGHECLDCVVPLKEDWQTSFRETRRLCRQLRDIRFDVAIDLQSATTSAWVARLSGASRRIGWSRPLANGLSNWLNNEFVTVGNSPDPLQLLGPLGISAPSRRFGVPHVPAAEASVDALIQEAHLGCGFVVMQIPPSSKHLGWPAQNIGKVARHLGELHRLTTVVIGGEKHATRDTARAVANSGGNALAVTPRSSGELLALIRRARLFVGADSGHVRLAAAMGTPSLGTCRSPSGDFDHLFDIRPCWIATKTERGDPRAPHEIDEDQEISVDVVCQVCEQLLDRRGSTEICAA